MSEPIRGSYIVTELDKELDKKEDPIVITAFSGSEPTATCGDIDNKIFYKTDNGELRSKDSDGNILKYTETQTCGDFKKYDSGKPRMSLIPPKSIEEVAKVLTEGARKYSKNNWRKCDDFDRYLDAAQRHINTYLQGNKIDDGEGGTNTNHLSNAIVSLMFVLEVDLENEE